MNLLLIEPDDEKAEELTQTVRTIKPDSTVVRLTPDDLLECSDRDLQKYDGAFIGLEAEDYDPIKLGRTLLQRSKALALVLCGATAADVYDCPHVYSFSDYRDSARLRKALDFVTRHVRDNVFIFFSKRVCHRLRLRDILFIESQKRLCHVVDVHGGEYDFYCKLDELSDTLGGSFFRCSKSYLLNRMWIKSISRTTVTLSDGSTFGITRKYAIHKEARPVAPRPEVVRS